MIYTEAVNHLFIPMLQFEEYTRIIEDFNKRLGTISDEIAGKKPADGTWSLKEIIGHLIDSAGNNHQRFVRLQEGNLNLFPTYNARFWIEKQYYQNANWTVLRSLWYNFNLHLLFIIEKFPDSSLTHEWILEEDLSCDLEWLIEDYYVHLNHHIQKFIAKCPD